MIIIEIHEATQPFFGPREAQSSENFEPWPENPFPTETAAPPLECGPAVVCRAATDAETGGPAGRPAFAIPKRRPPREGEIDTGRILLRLRRDRSKARSLAAPVASGRARHIGSRSPRRVSRPASDARGDGGDSDDGGDSPGEPPGPYPRIASRADASTHDTLPKNIDEWPKPPFGTSSDYQDWRIREENRKTRRGLIQIEAHIVSADKNYRWSPRWWETEEWAEDAIRYGGAKGREYGERLLTRLRNTPDVFHILAIDHPTFKDAVGELPHDLRLAPGDRVSIIGTPYKWRSRALTASPNKPYRVSLAFIPRDLRLLSTPYVTPRTPAVRALSDGLVSDTLPGHCHQVALHDAFGMDWASRVARDSALDHPRFWKWRPHTKQRVYDACVRIECERLGLAPLSIETVGV